MKKIVCLLTACALALSISFSANAQVKFGVKGGLNMTNLTGGLVSDATNIFKSYTGFNAGVALHVGLPFGFAIQPEVLYTQSGSKIKMLPEGGFFDDLLEDLNTRFVVGNIQIPIGIQWGVELGPVRPYVQVVPYIGFPVSFSFKSELTEEVEKIDRENFKSLDYGVGAGIGIDVWKLQVSARYNWSLGKLYTEQDPTIFDQMLEKGKGDAKLSGFELSLALFF
jgi:hypothetical protein